MRGVLTAERRSEEAAGAPERWRAGRSRPTSRPERPGALPAPPASSAAPPLRRQTTGKSIVCFR